MNANELADEFKEENNDWNEDNLRHWGKQTEAMLRQLQKERDLLFSAHSHEMVRADELQIEVDRLTMLVEATTTECNRLYRVIELNGKLI
jgi:hypothetical protein